MSETDEKPLQKITELTICGERYELAANGQGYLVTRTVNDAYGNPIPTKVNLSEWINQEGVGTCGMKVQSLLDHLVTAYRQLQTSRDARLGVGKEGKES